MPDNSLRIFLIFLVIVFSLVFMSSSAECKSTKSSDRHPGTEHIKTRLSEVKKHIQEKKKEIRLSKKKASEILNEIDKLDQQSSQIQSKITPLEAKKTQLTSTIASAQKEITSLNAGIAAKKNIISKRLVATFKLQQIGYMKILLASGSPVDMEKRYTFMNDIIRHDELEISEYLTQENDLVAEQNNYIAQKSQLDALTSELNAQNKALQSAKSQKKKMLEDIRHSTEITRKILVELQNSEETLRHTLQSLEESSETGTGFAAMRGKLPVPVKGKIDNIFGKTTGSMISSKGILFKIKSDADVKAVYDGRIVWTEWLKGYGNTIIVDHGNRYFTIYAHVGDIGVKVGDRVKAGEIIGQAGDAGLDTEKSLYFEIRHGETALNPEQWLGIR